MIKRFVVLPFILGFLGFSACNTVGIQVAEKSACGERDWFELGRGDGVRGMPNLGWREVTKTCQGFNGDLHRQYLNGWYAGVDEFCSPEHGFTFGKNGHSYYDVCPKDREKSFVSAYEQGLKIFLVENSNRMISKEIRSIENQLTGSSAVEEKSQLMLRLKDLESKKRANQKQIAEIENQMASQKTL